MDDSQKNEVVNVLKTINDPELGVDVWTLGLIYNLDFKDEKLLIKMTFTSPMCPYGPYLLQEIKAALTKQLSWIKGVDVEIVFEPLWQPSDELKAMLGIGGV